MDGPPMLPPISSFNDESAAPSADQLATPPPVPSSFAAATPPQSPGLNATSGPGKNRNPLTDLIDSEEQFVALMSAIIRVCCRRSRTLLTIVDNIIRKLPLHGQDPTFHRQNLILCSGASKVSSRPAVSFLASVASLATSFSCDADALCSNSKRLVQIRRRQRLWVIFLCVG